MKWKCSKCGEVVTSPPLNNSCPRGGSHSWTNAKFYNNTISKEKSSVKY